jgi:peptide/nickel transport system substrate-binding protein
MGRVGTVRHARRLLLLGLSIFVAASLIWGISGAFAASSSPVPSEKVILRVGWTQEPDNLNPFIGYETSAYEIFHLNYDLLVGFKASDLSPAPELATSWTHSSDGKVWTFKIRQGVKWQDGVAFTAKDVAFTYNYIIKNQLSAWASYCSFIKKVTAPDDSTAVFYCSKPKANILATWVPIVPEHIWSAISPKAAENSFANKPPIIGTGPFQCVEWKHGQFVRMVANKSYWKGAPKIDEVIFQNYQNHDTMAMDLKSGGIQAAWGLPDASFNSLTKTPGLTALAYGGRYEDQLGMNCYDSPDSLGNPVLRDPRFRQALNWAVDREKLVQVAYSGHALPATSVIPSDYYPPALDWHWEPPAGVKYTFDLGKAGAALDAAGYRDTNGDGVRDYRGKPIELRLFARDEAVAQQKAAMLIASWFKQIGLKIDYSVMSTGAMNDRIYNAKGSTFAPDYDLFMWNWGEDVDPDFIMSVFTTAQINSWSDCAWSNKDYDRLYTQQATTIDPQARKAVIWKMEELLYEQSPYIVLTYPLSLEAYNTDQWTGWVRYPAGKGGVFYEADNIDTFLQAQPKTATAVESGGGSPWALIAIIAVAAAIAAGAAVLIIRRRRVRKEEA